MGELWCQYNTEQAASWYFCMYLVELPMLPVATQKHSIFGPPALGGCLCLRVIINVWL